jgi:ferric-dicitrate binding protein FerR (iron transport regulator)
MTAKGQPRRRDKPDHDQAKIEADAALWLALHDQGIPPEREAEFFAWLAADQRHAAVFAELHRVWKALDRLTVFRPLAGGESEPDPKLGRRRKIRAACAAAALGLARLWTP